jgi:Asp-tRNA(Asn)/Glu-tRNA(Gln) amidotransferase A subunit family amidase
MRSFALPCSEYKGARPSPHVEAGFPGSTINTVMPKPSQPLHTLTATGIVASIASGHTTCEAVTRACLDQIAEREPEVQAWQYLDPEQAIAQARALDRGGVRGPLYGVPFAVKDIIDTCDMPTEYGSPIFQGHRPRRDAACVALSRKAGAVLMGKAVTTEFANVHPGKTRNPLDPARTPGGSSSGSAAAVAASMVPLAIGTQTTGSTTRPASYCGIVGYRPTWGALRTAGVMEASGSLDTLGILARSIEDVALYRDVLLGVAPQPVPETSAPRVGFCRTPAWPRLEPATQALLEGAAGRLARAGARLEEIKLPPEFEALEEAHRWISGFEMARNLTWEIERHWDEISEAFRNGRLKDGLACSYEQYVYMLERVRHCRERIMPLFERFDVLLAAAAAGEAPVGSHPVPHPWVYMVWTTLHVPSITLPVFTGPHGLPIGAQLIAKPHEDRRMFACARWVYRRLTEA